MKKIIKLLDKNGNELVPENGTVLYESATGTTGNIALNDSVANYKSYKIFYEKAGNVAVNEYFGNDKVITLFLSNYYNTQSVQKIYKSMYVLNNSITVRYAGYELSGPDGASGAIDENYILVYKVIGYK